MKLVLPLSAVLVLTMGCGGERDAPPPITTFVPPVDRVEPTDVPEGGEVVFGFRLPLNAKVTRRTPLVARAEVPYSLERTASYFRERVEVDKVETGPARTVFESARPSSPVDKSAHPNRVVVSRRGLVTEIEISPILPASTPQSGADPDVAAEKLKPSLIPGGALPPSEAPQ